MSDLRIVLMLGAFLAAIGAVTLAMAGLNGGQAGELRTSAVSQHGR